MADSFNGAVTFSLRKYDNPISMTVTHRTLQWGRNFFVTEIWEYFCVPTEGAISLQWGRNFFVTEISNSRILPIPPFRFNGAVTFSLRKYEYSILECDSLFALQWGRNFFVTEIPLTIELRSTSTAASMGP